MRMFHPWVGIVCIAFYSAVGIVCLGVGGCLAQFTRTEEIREGPPAPPHTTVTVRKVYRDHPANWGAAEGFALAGGLCFIGAALAYCGMRDEL